MNFHAFTGPAVAVALLIEATGCAHTHNAPQGIDETSVEIDLLKKEIADLEGQISSMKWSISLLCQETSAGC